MLSTRCTFADEDENEMEFMLEFNDFIILILLSVSYNNIISIYPAINHKIMDPWNSLGVAASFLSKDINYAQVLAAKKTLQLLADNKDTVIPIVQLCLACCNNDVYSIKELLTDNKGLLNTADGK